MLAEKKNICFFIINIFSFKKNNLIKNYLNYVHKNNLLLTNWVLLINNYPKLIKNYLYKINTFLFKLIKNYKIWKLIYKLMMMILNNLSYKNKNKNKRVKKLEEWGWAQPTPPILLPTKTKLTKLGKSTNQKKCQSPQLRMTKPSKI